MNAMGMVETLGQKELEKLVEVRLLTSPLRREFESLVSYFFLSVSLIAI